MDAIECNLILPHLPVHFLHLSFFLSDHPQFFFDLISLLSIDLLLNLSLILFVHDFSLKFGTFLNLIIFKLLKLTFLQVLKYTACVLR
jgi:hypothetical protein